MRQKINLRLFEIAILAVIATTISMTLIFYGLFQRQVQKDLKIDAILLKETGIFNVEVYEDKGEVNKTLEEQLNQMGNSLTIDIRDLRITWIDEDGTVLYDNDKDTNELENHADRPEVKKALEKGIGESVRKSVTMRMDTFYYAILLENGTILRVSREARSIGNVFFTAFPMMMGILVLIIVICILLAHFLTRQLLAPIEAIAKDIEGSSDTPVIYKELIPFMNTIRAQHENILAAAKSRQDFTANVSHELKTPLTAISGYAELIENHMVGAEEESHFAQEIRKNSERLLSLINDIIRLSELDGQETSVTYENLDLYEIVTDCMEGLQVNADRQGIQLVLEGEKSLMRGNRDMLCELVDNLVQNAIRYNNEGGKVFVKVKQENSNHPVLIVEDNGIGIPKDQQERVFERFYRVDKSRSKETGGTGLGLAIAKHIVELHDAAISLDSEPGQGTRIWVEF